MTTRNSSIIKLPGLADVHTHLREPGATQKEDFETGTRAAVAGGYTQILDMPNNIPPTITPKSLDKKIALSKNRIWCDVGFNFGATRESARFFKKIIKKVFGLKLYMNHTTGTLLVEKAGDREFIFRAWSSPLPIMVHAEGKTIETAINLAGKYHKKLHICHVTADQLTIIGKAKKQGINVTCEVCPHHLFLTKNDLNRLGPLGIMKPPLLSKPDQKRLLSNLDKIDMISTDHAPHTLEEKQDQLMPKFGVPGLETALPLMLSAVSSGLLSLDRLIELMSTNPRRIFHLPNQPDTFILLDFSHKFKISSGNLFTKCRWTPFEGLAGRGQIKKVVIRGKPVYENGKFIGSPLGKIIYPES